MIKENKKNKVKVRELEIELENSKGKKKANEGLLLYIIEKEGNPKKDIEFYLCLDRIKKNSEMRDYIEKIKQNFPLYIKNQEEFLKEIEEGKVLLNNEIYVVKKEKIYE